MARDNAGLLFSQGDIWASDSGASVASSLSNGGVSNKDEGFDSTFTSTNPPTRALFNFLFKGINALGKDIGHHGVMEWVGTQNYTHPALVFGTDNILYISKQSSLNQNPVNDSSNTYWVPLLSAAEVTLAGNNLFTGTQSFSKQLVLRALSSTPSAPSQSGAVALYSKSGVLYVRANGGSETQMIISGDDPSFGYVQLSPQSSTPGTPAANTGRIFMDSSGVFHIIRSDGTKKRILVQDSVTSFSPSGVIYPGSNIEFTSSTRRVEWKEGDSNGDVRTRLRQNSTGGELELSAVARASGSWPSDSWKKLADQPWADNKFAPKASPTFTGTVTIPAVSASAANTVAATKKYVDDEVSSAISQTVSDKTANYTIGSNDEGDTVRLTGSTARTFTLPDITGAVGTGWYVWVSNASTAALTLDGNGSDTIDGSTTFIIGAGYSARLQVTGSTTWTVLSYTGNAVPTARIENNAVTTAKIGDSQVTSAKIGDDQVTLDKLSSTVENRLVPSTGTTDYVLKKTASGHSFQAEDISKNRTTSSQTASSSTWTDFINYSASGTSGIFFIVMDYGSSQGRNTAFAICHAAAISTLGSPQFPVLFQGSDSKWVQFRNHTKTLANLDTENVLQWKTNVQTNFNRVTVFWGSQ